MGTVSGWFEGVWKRVSLRGEGRSAASGNPDPASLSAILGLGESNLANVSVNQKTVLGIPAVWRAVSTIADTLASLPFALYERTGDGSRPSKKHPCYYVTKIEPSPGVTGFNFRRALFARACFGDAFAIIQRNGVGRPVAFYLADLIPFYTAERELFYVGTDAHGRVQHMLRPEDVLHIKALTMDGMEGLNVVNVHRETFATAIAAQQYGSAFFGNGAHVSGVIESPTPIPPEKLIRLREQWQSRYGGVRRTGGTAVLDEGKTYKKIGLTPEEAALTDTKSFQVRDVARIFGIPLHNLQDLSDATFRNVESLSIQFVTLYLRPWAVQAEQEFAMKTLTEAERRAESHFFWFNMNALLRGDTQTRGTFYTQLFNVGAMNPDEIRELENMNKRPGGDEFFVPLNMSGSMAETEQSGATSSGDNEDDAAPAANKNT